MDLKAALTGNDSKAILSASEYGEDVAMKAYLDVLNNREDLGDSCLVQLIEGQLAEIRAGHNRVKAMRGYLIVNSSRMEPGASLYSKFSGILSFARIRSRKGFSKTTSNAR